MLFNFFVHMRMIQPFWRDIWATGRLFQLSLDLKKTYADKCYLILIQVYWLENENFPLTTVEFCSKSKHYPRESI